MRRFTVLGLSACLGCGLVYDYDGYAGSGVGGVETAPASSSAASSASSAGGSSAESTASVGGGAEAPNSSSSAGGEGDGGTAGSTSTSAGGGGAVDCAERGNVCLPVGERGWRGPVALVVASSDTGQGRPECALPFATEVFAGRAGPSALPASCECSCEVTNVACPVANVPIGQAPGEVCDDFAGSCTGTWNLSPGECAEIPFAGQPCGDAYALNGFAVGQPLEVTCTPEQEAFLPAVQWATNGVACSAPEEEGACSSGDVCVATVPTRDGSMCVFRAGNFDCSSPSYPDRVVLYSGVADTRGCTECSCSEEDVFNGTCSGTMTIYMGNDDDCTNEFFSFSVPAIECREISSGFIGQYGRYVPSPPSGECEAFAGEPMGGVQPAQPTTFCCAPTP